LHVETTALTTLLHSWEPAFMSLAGSDTPDPNRTYALSVVDGLLSAAGNPRLAQRTTITKKKTKRSTEQGEVRAKLIAALTEHHKYADGSCLNIEPIGNNALAKLARVSNSTASEFFKKEFGDDGRVAYKRLCRIADKLQTWLKQLNGDLKLGKLLTNQSVDNLDPEQKTDRHRKPKASDLKQDEGDEGE
jgi:hypothetical protein